MKRPPLSDLTTSVTVSTIRGVLSSLGRVCMYNVLIRISVRDSMCFPVD